MPCLFTSRASVWESRSSSTRLFGMRCDFTSHCVVGTCCLRRNTELPTCQLLARENQPCSLQAVQGIFTPHCPCGHGEGQCVNHICVKTKRKRSPSPNAGPPKRRRVVLTRRPLQHENLY
ncbi:U-scoloptoxin(18)-Er1a-like [Rhipicephalus microplus]|uniref:U-scoloptoxin(18)-Er1a-like n=1 Tax=Rhipicephalus microplus TaxID=6941 RepID=UPI003F6C06E2